MILIYVAEYLCSDWDPIQGPCHPPERKQCIVGPVYLIGLSSVTFTGMGIAKLMNIELKTNY